MEIRPMTPTEKFERLVYVAGWEQDAVGRLLETCAEKGFSTPEQILEYAQKVLDNQCLSVLRGGDAALDEMVAEAFRIGAQENAMKDLKIEELNRLDRFNYQLLSRLKQDCDYYLGNGQRHPKHLWALDEVEQIEKMKELYAQLPEKPEWCTLDDIEKYEAAMVGSAGAVEKPAKSPSMGM